MNFAFGLIAITAIAIAAPEDSARQSVLESAHSPSVLNQPAPADWNTQETVLEKPAVVAPVPFVNESTQAPFIAENRLFVEPAPIVAHPTTVCTTCRCVKCCCKKKRVKVRKPRKIDTKFCLVDPNGCSHEACVKVSECCGDEPPTVNWHQRPLGRKVATLCWECCDEEAKVIVTRRGKVKVRD